MKQLRIEDALYSYLSGHAGLAALVGNRIYPLKLPQPATLPAVTYHKLSGQRLHGFQVDPGYAHPRFQFSCWANTYTEAKDVTDQVQAALQDFSGTMGGAGGVNVDIVLFVNEIDKYELESGLYHVDLEFKIFYQE